MFLQQRGVTIISVTAVTKLQQLSAVTLQFLHAVHMVVSHFLPLVWRMPAGAINTSPFHSVSINMLRV